MLKLGLLDGKKEKLIEEKKYNQFFMHQVGHMLGLDVHDVNTLRGSEGFKTFQSGMVFTVEPGAYIASDAENVSEKRSPKIQGLVVRVVMPASSEQLPTRIGQPCDTWQAR